MAFNCFVKGYGQLNVALVDVTLTEINKKYFKGTLTLERKKDVWAFFLPSSEKPLCVFSFSNNRLEWVAKQADIFAWWCYWICGSVIGNKIGTKIELDGDSKIKPDFYLKYPCYSDYVNEEAKKCSNPKEAKERMLEQGMVDI